MTKKSKRALIIGLIALLIIVFLAIYTVAIKPKMEQSYYVYDETEIYEGNLYIGVSESGSLEYKTENINYDINVNVEEDDDDDDDDDEDDEELTQRYLEIEEVYVASGVKVKAGDKLLKFSDKSIQSVRKLLQSALTDAKADYNDAVSEYNLSALESETSLKKQQVAAKYATKVYNGELKSVGNDITSMQLEIETYTAKTESLQEDIDEAYESYTEALATYTEAKAYYDNILANEFGAYSGYVNTYNNAKSTYERALETYENAVSKLEENNEKINDLNSDIKKAKAKQVIDKLGIEVDYQKTLLYGDYAEIIYEAAIESLKEDLKEKEEDKTTMEEKLEAFEALVGEDGILYAPEDGVITSTYYEAGDELETTGVLFTYATAKNLTISVNVTEEDIVHISVGDSVTVEFNAYEGEEYEGVVTSINTTATSAGTPTVSYEVVVKVEGTLDKLYGGMTADIRFITKKSENTLYISRNALVEQNGSYYVYKKTGLTGKELSPVTIGIKNESYVEILDGITKNDTIYIPTLVNGKSEE